MRIKRVNFLLLVFASLVISLSFYSVSYSQVQFETDEQTFNNNNFGLTSEDFRDSNFTNGLSTVCTEPAADSTTNDNCFTPGAIPPGVEFFSPTQLLALNGPFRGGGPDVVALTNNSCSGVSFSISFAGNNVTAVGLQLWNLIQPPGSFDPTAINRIEVFSSNTIPPTLIGSTLADNSVSDFIGITSTIPIKLIRVRAEPDGGPFSSICEGVSNISFGVAGLQPQAINLSPPTATNDVLTDHTVTATVSMDGFPEAGVLVTFNVISGPNAGEMSDPNSGECSPNGDCTTDEDGQVSWTYTGSKFTGTDTIIASFTDITGTVIESAPVEKIWVITRSIPTLSEWGLIAMTVLLGIVGLLAIRRRNAVA